MSKYEELYHQIAATLPDATEGKMFGALCIKAPNGKAGVMFWKEDMIFKLQEADEQEALKLKGARTFTPAEGRPPMGGWIHIPNAHSAKWAHYAAIAMELVKKIEVKPKKQS